MRRFIALVAGVALALSMAGTALGHQVKTIQASAVCGGATTITVTGDVYGGVHLIVKVDGSVVFDQAQNTQDQSVRTFVINTNTQPGGHVAKASTSDGSSVSTEFSTPQPCPTPKPTPTPTPPPSPTPSPSHTPRPTPSLPNVTPPPTSTSANASKDGSTSGGLYVLIGVMAIIIFAFLMTLKPGRNDRDL